MGFTNVAWESRSAERLARDLTDGPGPMSVGQAGAAWVRLADEWASISAEYDKIVEKIKGSFSSQGADAAARKLEEFGRWLQSVSLSAASNGERAEEAAVAYGVAVLGMPSVSEAVQVRSAHEVMASLAAYNGAVLDGQFAEFDQVVGAHQADASAVMYQYEQSCSVVCAPWEEPVPPRVCSGAALRAERDATAVGQANGGSTGGGGGGVGMAVAPPRLAPFRPDGVESSRKPKALHKVDAAGVASGVGPAGTGYGPMAALGRGVNTREHHSSLDGGAVAGAGLSQADPSWLPAVQQSEAPLVVSHVSWGPDTSVFDGPAASGEPELPQYADAPAPTLEQVSDRWVSPPVIGVDKGLTL